MSKDLGSTPCWAVRGADGKPWDDEWDAHHDSQADAEESIRELRDNEVGELAPEDYAATYAHLGPEMVAKALASEQKRVAHIASLHPVELPGPCYTITCDGPDCGTEPEGENGGHLHFRPGDEFSPGDWDWVEHSGKHFCDDCRIAAICDQCEGLSGDGARDRDGMCPKCWKEDQRKPGEGQTAIEVTA